MNTLWIENVSMEDVRNGTHTDMGDNAMLIQITDPAYFPPIPKQNFKTVVAFEFLDAEDEDIEKYGYDEDFLISDSQAANIVALLNTALQSNMNVLVHCHQGVCRSGSIVEVGEILGFVSTGNFRAPNLRVKHKMMKALGLDYDPDESPFIIESGNKTNSPV